MDNENTEDAPITENKQKKKPMGSTFSKDIVVEYEGGGEIHLRRPTIPELNAFNSDSRSKGRKKFKIEDADLEGARVKLFDKLFIKIVNFTDNDGNPLPEDALEYIPDDEKTHIITQGVQVKEIDIKN